MKDQKYRELMADIYRLVESMECPPDAGDEESAGWWQNAANKVREICGKWEEEPYSKLASDMCIVVYTWAERTTPGTQTKLDGEWP